ncbi:hypothetical protein QYF36_003960 [Acer negundo]|nr:hypothetical protein QYF36_003960 [Acer negundo]
MDLKRKKLNNQAFFFHLMNLFILVNPSKPDEEVSNISLSSVAQVHVGVIVEGRLATAAFPWPFMISVLSIIKQEYFSTGWIPKAILFLLYMQRHQVVEHNCSNFIQITHGQAKGIATLIKAFKWKDAILIYEDNNSGRDFFPHMFDSSQDANIHIAHRISIPPSSSHEHIIEKLSMIKTFQTKVFVVHMSHSLASHFFLKVKKL